MKYGTTHAALKPLSEILLPDPRFAILKIGKENERRPFEPADLHRRLCLTKLNSKVPEDVRTQFQTALNLMLYAWFVFEFHTVAEQQAYGALELALRLRFPQAVRTIKKRGTQIVIPWTLGPLLRLAVNEGAIDPETLPAWERANENRRFYEKSSSLPPVRTPTANEWFENLIESIPTSRNHLAHGNPQLYWEGSFWKVEFCADLINALFLK
jgi:hypothetical protein